jgi:hypothetical protein
MPAPHLVPRRPLSSVRGTVVALLALALPVLAACNVRYGVEEREVPVYVWIDVPAALTTDQRVDLTLTVGGRQVANGTYLFPAGRPRQEMPTVYLRTGNHPVVVTRGGTVVASETVPMGHVNWLVVTIDGAGARIARTGGEPAPYR